MAVALQLLAGAIVGALGANLFTRAPEDAAAEQELLSRWLGKPPSWNEGVRRWSNRLGGLLLIAFGVAIGIDAVV